MEVDQPKLYTELSSWWQLISSPGGYAGEAAFFAKLFRAEGARTGQRWR